jgi:hypothetical protein
VIAALVIGLATIIAAGDHRMGNPQVVVEAGVAVG